MPPRERERERDRERKPARRPRPAPRAGGESALQEVERQLRQVSRSLDGAARGLGRLADLVGELVAEGGQGSGGAASRGEGGNHRGSEPSRRLQPAAELPGATQASTQALEQALTTPVDEAAKDLLTQAVELFEDVDRGIPDLNDCSMRGRSAYLAVWAGGGRALQASLEPWWDELPEGVEKSFRVFFGKLTTVTKRLRCEWVDALHRAWSTEWEVYVRFYKRRLHQEMPEASLGEASLSAEEDQQLAADRLEGLLQRNRPRPSDARQLILDAAEVTEHDHPVMVRVLQQYAGLLRGHSEFDKLLADSGLHAGDAEPGAEAEREGALEGAARD